MSSPHSLKDVVHRRAVKHSRRLSLRRLVVYVGLGLGGGVLIAALLILVFGKTILSGYGKSKLERAFAAAHPGWSLRIGELDYAFGADRLVARSVTLSRTNTVFKVSQISLTGVHWAPLLRGTAVGAEDFADASLEATDLEVELPQAHYGIHCTRLRASVPDSELILQGTEVRPAVGDEAFFAAHDYRTPRFRVDLPECRVLGLAYGEAYQGKAYRARSVHFSRPSLDALLNSDKPPKPFVKSPLMVHEALASLQPPLQVDSLTLTNGHLRYCTRLGVGADPAVLTFGAVSMSVTNIANRGDATAAIQLQAQGDLMDAGTLKVRLSIPIAPPDFSLHYSGSLTAMDLTRLAGYLDIAEHTRITSGSVKEAVFDIDVKAGEARGSVRVNYEHLMIAVLDKKTGTEEGLNNRIASFLANVLKVRTSNAPDASGSVREGKASYTRSPEDEFLEFLWFALWSGVRDAISH